MLNAFTYDRTLAYIHTKVTRFPEHAEQTRLVQLSGETNAFEDWRRAHTFYGWAVDTVTAQGDPALVFWPDGEIKNARYAYYLVSDPDAKTTTAYYVAGWNDEVGYTVLCPFAGSPVFRHPRRAYVLTIHRHIEQPMN